MLLFNFQVSERYPERDPFLIPLTFIKEKNNGVETCYSKYFLFYKNSISDPFISSLLSIL